MRPVRLGVSAAILVALIVLGSASLGPLPPLLHLLNPSSGLWVAEPPYANGTQSIVLSQGSEHASVTVFKEADGFIGITSNETWGFALRRHT